MPATIINDARGITQTGGSGLTIESNVVFKGEAKFLGGVSGIGSSKGAGDVTFRCTELSSPVGTFDYDCSGNTRFFRHVEALTGPWTANFAGLSLQNLQVVTVKISTINAESAEYFLEDVLIDGEPIVSFVTSSMYGLKFRKGGKQSIATFDIMRNEKGEIYVYADVVQDLVP